MLPSESTFAALNTAPKVTCFDFRHVARTSKGECIPSEKTSLGFYYAGGVREHCPNNFYYLRPATIAAAAYANLRPAHAVCRAIDSRVQFDTTLVVHLRSGDLWNGHGGYGQPPFAYFLAAWAHSNLPRLHIVTENVYNPVVKLFHLLSSHITRMTGTQSITIQSASWKQDINTLMCARHVIFSRSTINTVLRTNWDLRTIYEPSTDSSGAFAEPLAETWIGSCQTAYYVASAPWRNPWDASHEQLLELAVKSWNESASDAVKFRRYRVGCLFNSTDRSWWKHHF